ncbi:MAG: PorT family protein [Bacteroidales bacterium]|nr:PorT family protein [Bacteroidales bacterium]
MKKKVFIILFAFTAMFAQAQWSYFGFRAGMGPANISDDILMRHGITGYNFTAYINYGFSQSESYLRNTFYLQTGVSLMRRGGYFSQKYNGYTMGAIREGFFDMWYAQVPVLAAFQFELPRIPYIDDPLVLHAYLGPAVSVGLWGDVRERKIAPTYPQATENYDHEQKAFDVIGRLDVNAIIGIGLHWRNFTFDMYYDHGFMVLYDEIDISDPEGKRKSFSGNNQAFIFSLGYKLPIYKNE